MHSLVRWSVSRPSRVTILSLTTFLVGACNVVPGTTPYEQTIKALWNPTESTLPTPTDLARDAEAGRLDLPLDDDLTAAERDFRRFLNTLDGFPTTSKVTIPFSGPLDPTTLADNVLIFDAHTLQPAPVQILVDDTHFSLTLEALDEHGEPWRFAPGRTYIYAVRGYENGVRGARGELVIADMGFYFMRSRQPLTEHPDAFPGDKRQEKIDNAESAEEVRQEFVPLWEKLVQYGWLRDEVAVLGSFTTQSTRPVVSFDPPAEEIPFPNNLLIDLDTGLVDVPIPDDASPEELDIIHALRTYDGFSANAAIVIKSNIPVDRASVTAPDAVRVFRIDGAIEEVTDLERGVADDSMSFWVRPALTFEHSAIYAYVVTRQARAITGEALESDVFAALLRLRAPVYWDGESQLDVLSDEDAAKVEASRSQLHALLDHLEVLGLRREDIAAAVPFRTISAPKTIVNMRQNLYTANIPTNVWDVVVKTPWERGLYIVMPQVETIVTGKMPIHDYIDPYTSMIRESGEGQLSSSDFVLTIPKGYSSSEPIPVVLFGHGLMTSRELVYMVANRLASAGFAAFSMDLPYHGNRSACRNDLECHGSAKCYADSRCYYEYPNHPGMLREVASPWSDGFNYPVTSGLYFVEPENLVASRDHFLQAMLDVCQGVRVLREADWLGASGFALDGNDIVYLGMSLGGIVGSNLAAVETELVHFALNVPGAGLADLMQDSVVFGPMLDIGLEAKGIERNTPEFFAFDNVARWLLDPIEPLNFAHHAFVPIGSGDTTLSASAKRPTRLLIQKAQGDLVIPNSATDRLGARTGVDVSVYTPLITNHAFLFDPTSAEGAAARDEIVEFFADR